MTDWRRLIDQVETLSEDRVQRNSRIRTLELAIQSVLDRRMPDGNSSCATEIELIKRELRNALDNHSG